MKITHLILAVSTTLTTGATTAADSDAKELIHRCLYSPNIPEHHSKVTIHVTHKNKADEKYHFTRLQTNNEIFLKPENIGGYGYLRRKDATGTWQHLLYNAENATYKPLVDAEQYRPEWLFSENLLNIEELSQFGLVISSHNAFGGQDYYTVKATGSGAYPNRSLSFKQTSADQCDLIRAAYFDSDNKLRKKLFFQWQTIAGAKTLKTIHIEDVKTLEAVRYHIEEINLSTESSNAEMPTRPDLTTSQLP